MSPRAVVFAPSPLLTVTIEAQPDGGPEIHLHAGGQGVWIARMLATLGLDVLLCTALGGETGTVLRELFREAGADAHVVDIAGNNGAYVHDRRAGERAEVAEVPAPALNRHELDALCNATLVEGLQADVVVLGGPDGDGVLAPDTYRRLAADLAGRGACVVADLSGRYLGGWPPAAQRWSRPATRTWLRTGAPRRPPPRTSVPRCSNWPARARTP